MPRPSMSHEERLRHVAAVTASKGEMLSPNGKVALAYAAAGFCIFPCSAGRKEHKASDRLPFGKAEKTPVGVSSWSKEATTDVKKIREWWETFPQALVALPCKQNRLFVIDADRHTAEQDGVAAFAALCEGQDEPMPPHPVIVTDYEGEHHIFRMPDEPIGHGKNKLPPGIETRGYQQDNDGGYIIASGSRMPDGRSWSRITGTPSLVDAQLSLPPQWLIELSRPPQTKAAPVIQLRPAGKNEEAYAMSALNRVAAELAAESEGRRDNLLLSVAGTMGRMIQAGWIGYSTVEGRLLDACRSNKLLDEISEAKARDKIKRAVDAVSPHEPLAERPALKGNSGAKPDHGARREDSSPLRSIVAIRGDKVKPESISWAWKNRIAFGKMTMFAGDPGLGKSTLLTDVAALHTIGGDFPCGEGKAILCEVAILTAEDGLADTLAPRLIAAGADMSKIHFITGTKFEGNNNEAAMFDITQDVVVLRKYLKDNPAIKVLIIDPLTAYLGAGTKAKENTDVRRVLTPLVRLIEDFAIALLVNNHLNKNSGKALYRILDSIAFTAIGRIIHLIIEDADNRDLKKFICSKINIGSMPLGLTYIIQKTWINGEQGEEIETSRISWGVKHIDETADEALGTSDDTPSMAEEAEKFLNVVLASGRMLLDDLVAEARQAGLLGADKEIRNSKPFRTACEKLSVIHDREGFGRGAKYYWRLP